jgi:hypothetical protein
MRSELTPNCHPERSNAKRCAAQGSALKITPRYHHNAVILRSVATKDPRLFFHAFGWNTVPFLTAVAFSAHLGNAEGLVRS